MCQQCVDSLDRYFPTATESERSFILWEMTPFPFGRPEDVERSLRALHVGFVLRALHYGQLMSIRWVTR